MPSGKPNKEFHYDLEKFILPVNDDDDNSIASLLNDDAIDEEFSTSFTLSKFSKDLMVIATNKFPEEYSLKKGHLDPNANCTCRNSGILLLGLT